MNATIYYNLTKIFALSLLSHILHLSSQPNSKCYLEHGYSSQSLHTHASLHPCHSPGSLRWTCSSCFRLAFCSQAHLHVVATGIIYNSQVSSPHSSAQNPETSQFRARFYSGLQHPSFAVPTHNVQLHLYSSSPCTSTPPPLSHMSLINHSPPKNLCICCSLVLKCSSDWYVSHISFMIRLKCHPAVRLSLTTPIENNKHPPHCFICSACHWSTSDILAILCVHFFTISPTKAENLLTTKIQSVFFIVLFPAL